MAEDLTSAPCEMCGGGVYEGEPCLCEVDGDPYEYMCVNCRPGDCLCAMCDGDPCLCGVPSRHEPEPVSEPLRLTPLRKAELKVREWLGQ